MQTLNSNSNEIPFFFFNFTRRLRACHEIRVPFIETAKFGGDFGGVATLLTCTSAAPFVIVLNYAGRPLFLFLCFFAHLFPLALTYNYKVLETLLLYSLF